MTANIANDWEDVLNDYLEGRAFRADAEDLRLRLHLSAEERDQVERSLHLADEITAAVRQPTPSAEFEAKLRETIRASPAPAAMPQGWASDPAGGFRTERPAPPADDEADLLADDAETIEALRAEPPIPPADPAMADRLRDGLRAFMRSDAGEIDQRIADRLLGGARVTAKPADFPDVLAAEDNPDLDDPTR